jgi:hypothetical protein
MTDHATQSGIEIAESFPALTERVADRLLDLLLPVGPVPGSLVRGSKADSRGHGEAGNRQDRSQSDGTSSEPLAS